MLRRQLIQLALPTFLAIALIACHSRDQQQLHSFAMELNAAAASLTPTEHSGTLTLHIDHVWDAGVAILPAQGSAKDLHLPEALTKDLEDAVAHATSPHVFFIRNESIAADETLEPTFHVLPGYGKSPKTSFTISRDKASPQTTTLQVD